jgi:hypothetical protein
MSPYDHLPHNLWACKRFCSLPEICVGKAGVFSQCVNTGRHSSLNLYINSAQPILFKPSIAKEKVGLAERKTRN